MTGLTYDQVYHELMLYDYLAANHLWLVENGRATAWPEEMEAADKAVRDAIRF